MERLITQFYIDDQFLRSPYKDTRIIARAIVFDGLGHIAIHKINRDDIFGKAIYYETPGGGVEPQESLIEALKRECDEELGYEISVYYELGIVNDEYALIGRKNENHYFIAKANRKTKIHETPLEHRIIEKTLWISLEEAISLYGGLPDKGIEKLLKQRELPILQASKRLYDMGEFDDFLKLL